MTPSSASQDAPALPASAYLPARWLPLLYFAHAHLALLAALAALVTTPQSLVGFFYHPRMLAVVHLVTLGWISGSILGALYIVGPLALRLPLPARRADYVAFGSFAVGVNGMVNHFWFDLPAGMAWSAGLVAAAMAYVAARCLSHLRSAPAPLAARLPIGLALVNMLVAAGLGVLVAIDKVTPVLGVRHLDAVLAHAHLAAIGWGTLMVVGVGYRILPMVLPSAMPHGFWAHASAVLLEAGVLGLVGAWFGGGRGLVLATALVVAGLLSFLSRIVWMLRHRRPAPSERRRPDWAVAHVAQALLCLIAAVGLGVYLALAEPSSTTLAVASAYGVLGLLGFLSQIVVGVQARLVPMFAWSWGFSDRACAELPPSLHGVSAFGLQGLSFGLWAVGIPALAWGLAAEQVILVSCASAGLLLAVAANLVNASLVLARLWRRQGS